MEIGNFAMAKGLQCVLALFPRNNRFSESFLALFRAKWAVFEAFFRAFCGFLPPRHGLAAAAEESPRKMQNSKANQWICDLPPPSKELGGVLALVSWLCWERFAHQNRGPLYIYFTRIYIWKLATLPWQKGCSVFWHFSREITGFLSRF
jgi:hypothetical protein